MEGPEFQEWKFDFSLRALGSNSAPEQAGGVALGEEQSAGGADPQPGPRQLGLVQPMCILDCRETGRRQPLCHCLHEGRGAWCCWDRGFTCLRLSAPPWGPSFPRAGLGRPLWLSWRSTVPNSDPCGHPAHLPRWARAVPQLPHANGNGDKGAVQAGLQDLAQRAGGAPGSSSSSA